MGALRLSLVSVVFAAVCLIPCTPEFEEEEAARPVRDAISQSGYNINHGE